MRVAMRGRGFPYTCHQCCDPTTDSTIETWPVCTHGNGRFWSFHLYPEHF